MSWPRYLPESIGPPETKIVGRSTLAAPIRIEGVVLSQPPSSTTPSSGLPRLDSSASLAARAPLAEQHHGEFERKATRLQNAVAHVVGEDTEMRIARCELGPGVADADDRTAVELVVRHAAVLYPAPIDEAIDVLAAEPLRAAALFVVSRWHGRRRCRIRRRSRTSSPRWRASTPAPRPRRR